MHSPCIPWQHGLPEISQVMWRSSPDTKLVLLAGWLVSSQNCNHKLQIMKIILMSTEKYNSHILFEKYCWTLYTRNYRKCTYCYCKSCFVSQKSGNILYISIATLWILSHFSVDIKIIFIICNLWNYEYHSWVISCMYTGLWNMLMYRHKNDSKLFLYIHFYPLVTWIHASYWFIL
jgi:hypothetical protein